MSAMLGKAMVSNQISKISKGLGIDEKEDDDQPSVADVKKLKKEELQREEEKKKRDVMQAKRRAERTERRDEIRAKYGLKKESETSVTNSMANPPVQKTQVEDKKSDKCCIM